MMIQLILHGVGDYWLPTDEQAKCKKRPGKYGWWMCYKHCITYSIPFLFVGSWVAVCGIFLTHFLIDRTNIIERTIAFKNRVKTIENYGFDEMKPKYISFWLFVICDNIAHLACNYLALTYL